MNKPILNSWIVMRYGTDEYEWYVLDVTESKVKLGKPSWLVSASMWMTIEEADSRGAEFLSYGKRRWWWYFMPFRNLIVPISRTQ